MDNTNILQLPQMQTNTLDSTTIYWSNIYDNSCKENKMDKAFKIIKSLMDKKIIKDDISIKEFMEICEVISKEI